MKKVMALSLKKSNKSIAILAVFSILFTILLLSVLSSGCKKEGYYNRHTSFIVHSDYIKAGDTVRFENTSFESDSYSWTFFENSSVFVGVKVISPPTGVSGVCDTYKREEDVYVRFDSIGNYDCYLSAKGDSDRRHNTINQHYYGNYEKIVTVHEK